MIDNIELILIIVVIVLAILMLLFWLRIRPKKVIESKTDKLKISAASPFQFNGLDKSIKLRILNAINNMSKVGDDAEVNYQLSLKELQPDSKIVVQAIDKELKIIPIKQFLDRWSLIQLLAELKDPTSLPVLNNLLSKKIPEEMFAEPHPRSSLRQETINLTTAVEAITRIALNRNADAIELLLKQTAHESLSVRRACVQGYLAHGGKNAKKNLSQVLPQNDHYLLKISRLDIEEVPQISIDSNEIQSRYAQKVHDVPRVTPKRDQ